mmetsp:Transcript_33988/g.30767  ORF Transcript_33988/g.30767 Transcript_33988/m.30767 type:complete len:151 (-) Transcript_33988:2117-2569(-)
MEITKKLIILIQLFCEDCYDKFQNFLRHQEFTHASTTFVSLNIVNEISNFLVSLQLIDGDIYYNEGMLPIVKYALATLTDFCLGPCQKNQVLLGNQRHLISFINNLIDRKIEFGKDQNENLIDVFSNLIKLILAIINGNTHAETKEFVLN